MCPLEIPAKEVKLAELDGSRRRHRCRLYCRCYRRRRRRRHHRRRHRRRRRRCRCRRCDEDSFLRHLGTRWPTFYDRVSWQLRK